MDRTSSFPKQDFEGMVCEIWSGLDICLYHAAYVRTYADSTAMRLAGSRRRETILQQMSQADRDFLQEDVLVFRAHFAGVLWQLHHLADELVRLSYKRCYQEGILIAKWGGEIAEDIKPLEIQKWFNRLHHKEDYGWTTVSKIRGIMNRIFKIGIIHKKVSKNPVEGLATSTKTTYKAIKITSAQTLLILRSVMGNMLHFTLVFVVAATALRSSEVLSLRWADILWEDRKIRIKKSRKKTTLDLYTDEDLDEMIAAQEKFLDAVGFESGSAQ